MASQGPNSPGTIVNDSTVGTRDWNSPSEAATSDDVYATQDPLVTTVSRYLKATNFGFSSFTGTVTGIKVEVERHADADGGGDHTVDNSVRLVIGGNPTGDNKADVATHWPVGGPADAYAVYGGEGDTWGLPESTLIVSSEFTDSNFGVAFACETVIAAMNGSLVDHIRITLYYVLPSGAVVSSTQSAFILAMISQQG